MISLPIYWPDGLGVDSQLESFAILFTVCLIFALVSVLALFVTSKHLANVSPHVSDRLRR